MELIAGSFCSRKILYIIQDLSNKPFTYIHFSSFMCPDEIIAYLNIGKSLFLNSYYYFCASRVYFSQWSLIINHSLILFAMHLSGDLGNFGMPLFYLPFLITLVTFSGHFSIHIFAVCIPVFYHFYPLKRYQAISFFLL
jgi:hypothetical protein